MKVADIVGAIEEFAPLSIQEKWDNSGLAVGSPDADVHKVLIGFDCTPELVDEAVSEGADMIVTHHPLIFGGLKRITPEDFVGLAVIKAIKAGICVYAAHTTADKVISGVSGAMAKRMDLVNVSILEPDGNGDVGLGVIGQFREPMTAIEAVEYVKKKFALKYVRCSRPIDGPLSRVAMCGGSGSSLIDRAMASGADLYISGDISYHHFFTTPTFMVIDIGHFESEVDITGVLFSLLTKNFPNFAIQISSRLRESNPVHYL